MSWPSPSSTTHEEHFQVPEAQTGDWKEPVQSHQEQIVLMGFGDEDVGSVDGGVRWMVVPWLLKAFGTVSHSNLIVKLVEVWIGWVN